MTSCGMTIAGLVFQSASPGELQCTKFLPSKWFKIGTIRKSFRIKATHQFQLEQILIFHRLIEISSIVLLRFGSQMKTMIDTSMCQKSACLSISQTRMTNSSLTSSSLNLKDLKRVSWRNGETIIMVDLLISSLLINSAEICLEDKVEHLAKTQRLLKFQCQLLMTRRRWNATEIMSSVSSFFPFCTMRISTLSTGLSRSLKMH